MKYKQFTRENNFTRGSLVSIVIILLAFSGKIYSQEQRIVFSNRTVTISEAFKEIEKQTEILISLNHSDFNLNRKIKLSHNNLTLKTAFEQLLAKTNRTYLIKGNHVLIIPKKQPVETVSMKPFSEVTDSINSTQHDKKEPLTFPLPIKFQALDLTKPPMDLDSLENALLARKIDYPLETPSEPSINQTLYYRKRDREGFTPGIPAYTNTLPKYALRTNLLYGLATLTPNIGAEYNLAQKSTVHATFSYNGWNKNGTDTNNDKLCHWLAQAEYRYWLCESFNGHFLGANAFYGYYNISGKKIPMILESNSDLYRYKGNVMGIGVSYGYQLMLASHWNLEFNIGFGVGRMKYDKWDCIRCGDEIEKDASRIFFAPNKLGISLVYIIK